MNIRTPRFPISIVMTNPLQLQSNQHKSADCTPRFRPRFAAPRSRSPCNEISALRLDRHMPAGRCHARSSRSFWPTGNALSSKSRPVWCSPTVRLVGLCRGTSVHLKHTRAKPERDPRIVTVRGCRPGVSEKPDRTGDLRHRTLESRVPLLSEVARYPLQTPED